MRFTKLSSNAFHATTPLKKKIKKLFKFVEKYYSRRIYILRLKLRNWKKEKFYITNRYLYFIWLYIVSIHENTSQQNNTHFNIKCYLPGNTSSCIYQNLDPRKDISCSVNIENIWRNPVHAKWFTLLRNTFAGNRFWEILIDIGKIFKIK